MPCGRSARGEAVRGAVAALSELHRLVTRSSTEDPLTAATTTLESWRLQRASTEHLGPVWRTYRDGGIAALEAVVEELGTTGHPQPRPLVTPGT